MSSRNLIQALNKKRSQNSGDFLSSSCAKYDSDSECFNQLFTYYNLYNFAVAEETTLSLTFSTHSQKFAHIASIHLHMPIYLYICTYMCLLIQEAHIKKYSLRVDSWDVKQNIWKWQAEFLLLLHQIIPFHHIPGKSLFLKF